MSERSEYAFNNFPHDVPVLPVQPAEAPHFSPDGRALLAALGGSATEEMLHNDASPVDQAPESSGR